MSASARCWRGISTTGRGKSASGRGNSPQDAGSGDLAVGRTAGRRRRRDRFAMEPSALPFFASRRRSHSSEDRKLMPEDPIAIDQSSLGLHSLEQYEPLIGAPATERIFRKAERARGEHIVHVSSTFYGGGVAEILTPLTLL